MQLDELAKRIASYGLCAAQFAAIKSIPGFDTDAGRVSPGLAAWAREAFRSAGVSIAVLGCYINLGTPDEADAQFQMGRFKEYLRHARDFGCSMVGTETGSVLPNFAYHPDNHGEAAFQRVAARVRELVREAERFGVFVAIEGVTSYVINSPKRIKRLIDEVASNNMQIILDPVNLINAENYKDQNAIIEEAFALFGDRIAAFHAKDFIITQEGSYRQVAAGTAGGLLNYPLFFKLAKERRPFAYVILEDTKPETLAQTVAFTRELWEKA